MDDIISIDDAIQKIVSIQGFLVVAKTSPERIGGILTFHDFIGGLRTSFTRGRVTKEVTQQDFLNQLPIVKEVYQCDFLGDMQDFLSDYKYYYLVEAVD